MTKRQRSAWALVAETYPCPTCDAVPGERCITSSGKMKVDYHAARTRWTMRCPGCGIRLAADAEPGDYCDLCTVYRQARAERYAHPDPGRREGRIR